MACRPEYELLCNRRFGGLPMSTLTVNFNGTTDNVSGSTTHAGWTLGAGLEWMFVRQWSAKVEYLYVDLGHVSNALPISNNPSLTENMRASALTTIFSFDDDACTVKSDGKLIQVVAFVFVSTYFLPRSGNIQLCPERACATRVIDGTFQHLVRRRMPWG